MSIHLLIPMAGAGKRFIDAGYTEPKPLIEANGIPTIERLLKRFPIDLKTTFVLAEAHRTTRLPIILKKLRPDSSLLYVPQHNQGPGQTIKLVLNQLDKSDSYLVSYCDYDMVFDYDKFKKFVEESHCDACIVSYRGFHAHYLSSQTYAYSRIVDDRVVEIKEKSSFTNNRENEYASCGAYYFKSYDLLKMGLEEQFKQKLIVNNEYYISLTLEALLRLLPQTNVQIFEIPYFFQLGEPQDLENFAYWENSFNNSKKFHAHRLKVAQILIPAAGKGRRFNQITKISKPFIPIKKSVMINEATLSLPTAGKTIWAVLSKDLSDAKKFGRNIDNLEIVELAETLNGQAHSVLSAINHLDPNQEVIVSACDHAIALNPKTWHDFKSINDADAAIFTIKGFPGVRRSPNSFTYVQTIHEETISPITKVSVKAPFTNHADREPMLVGTFWFASASILKSYLEQLIDLNILVNGECYLDSIFELLINDHLKVYSIQLDSYLGWGDPDSMAEALYWDEVFNSPKQGFRSRYPNLKGSEHE